MAWAKNGSTNLSSAGDNITLSNLTASKTNMFLCHGFASGSNPVMAIQYNSDTGSNYARRGSTNGSADGTATSGTYAHLSGGGLDTGAGFVVGYILNVSSEEKLSINFFSNGATIGAATAPDRGEYTGKWANTSDSITTINITNANTGDFGTNSNLSVLGSELTPASAKTIETGSIYIDTDTNNRWWYDGTDWRQPIIYNQQVADNSYTFIQASAGNGTRAGIKVASGSGAIGKSVRYIRFKIVRTGSPGGTLYCRVRNSSGTVIAETSESANGVSTSIHEHDFDLGSYVTLSAGDRIMLELTTGSSGNGIWMRDLTSNTMPSDFEKTIYNYSSTYVDSTTTTVWGVINYTDL